MTIPTPQKNTFCGLFPRETGNTLAFALLLLISFSTSGAETAVQKDWVPDNFFVLCDGDSPCPLSQTEGQKVARMMSDAMNALKKMPFKAPVDWGRRVGTGTANDYIELYQRGAGTLAGAAAKCGNASNYSKMLVGPDIREFEGQDYLLFYFMAHEVFHLSQYAYPLWDSQICTQWVPGWLLESMATAVGLEVMRKKYPAVAPSRRSDREARMFSGLRRYDVPLPHRSLDDTGDEMWSGDFPQYFTASFWRHIANTYHDGTYGFLSTYMKRTGRIGDWMPWLRNNIEKDLYADLGMVFAGFLTDYAGWGDPGYPGLFFGRRTWLKEAFGECEKVYLDKNNASDYIEFKVLPLSGKCIEVRVSALGDGGLQEGESAAVQIAAIVMEGSPSNRDGLHLGMAMSNDKKDFLCAREVKRDKLMGLGRCLLVPDDGKIRLNRGLVDARVWNVKAQEKSDPAQRRQEQGEGKGELVNIYTVSYTPGELSSSDTIYGGRNPVSVRFYFVLDVSKQKVSGLTPSEVGSRKKRTVGSFASGSDPQTTLPKQNASGGIENSYTLPDSLRPSIPSLPMMGAQIQPKLFTFTITQGPWDGDSNINDSSLLMISPAKEAEENKLEPYPLSVGETGSFRAIVIGSLVGGAPLVDMGLGSLFVDEFTDLVFRARYEATMCRLKDIKQKQECPDPITFSGQIVKAFAGSRLPGNYMVIERTPGTEMYRKAAEQGFSQWSRGTSEAASSGPGSPAPGTGGSGLSIAEVCECTCEEQAGFERRGKDIAAAGDNQATMAMARQMMACVNQCGREYMICDLEAAKVEKQRQALLREQAAQAIECDCSCAAMIDRFTRAQELGERMAGGGSVPVEEFVQISECGSRCQQEMIGCASKQ